MSLVARSVANGFLHGIQASQQRGVGIEFSQYRAYEPGDPPARIDWKLFARSDRYFVREAERESETDIWLVLDASRSMAQSSENGVWSKFDYARHLVATLAYLAQSQGDRVGLLVLSTQHQQRLRALAGIRQWQRIVITLEPITSAGVVPAAAEMAADIARLQQAGLVIVVSDLYQQRAEFSDFLQKTSTSHNEVAVLQLECDDERTFPFTGAVRFEDLETGEQILASGKTAREGYLRARKRWLEDTRRALGRWGVGIDTVSTDEPMDQALFAFLKRRYRGPAQ